MISTQEIAELIKDPSQVKNNQLKDLEALLEKYPYSSTLFMLYCKGVSLNSKIELDDILKNTSAHAVDRERLHKLIESEDKEIEIPDTTTENVQPIETGKKEEVEEHSFSDAAKKDEREEIVTAEVFEDEETLTEEQVEQEESTEAVLESDNEKEENTSNEKAGKEEISSDETIEEETVRIEEPEETDTEEIDETSNSEMNELDQTILSSALGTAYEIAPDSVLSDSDEMNSGFSQGSKSEEALDSEEPTPSPPKDMSFVEWLRYKQKAHGLEKNTPAQRPFAEKSEEKKSKAEFFDPSKKARESLEEQEDMVTETLAKIHVMQKNYGKAIEAYEQLSLLYPEKKAFFASQIEKINDKIR